MAGEATSIRSNRSSVSRSIKRSVASRQEHARSIRRVSIVIQEGGDHHPPEKFTFVLGDAINNEDTSLGRFRNRCGKFVNNYWVQVAMTALIVLNAILLGALTFKSVQENADVFNALTALDTSMLVAFTIEFLFQFVYLGPGFIRHTYLIFDLVVLILSWSFFGSSLAVFRSLRIFRVFILVSKWKSLQELVRAVGKTLPKLSSIWVCLLLFFYVYTVLCTSLYIDLYDEGYLNWPYFERMDYTFITLFQFMTLDSWHGVVRQVQEARPWSWLCFYSFAIIAAFVILNLFVAVVCEALVELRAEDKEEEELKANDENLEAAPVEDMIEQQTDILRAQLELERTMNKLMALVPPQ